MRFVQILLGLSVVAALALAPDAPAGGIADEPCPNVAGEYTNTCPSGTLGAPYSLRFVEREGSGCGPGRQTFHLDSGLLPAGLTLAADGTLTGTPLEVGRFQFYVQMREPQDDPLTCAGKRTEKQFTLRIRKPLSIVSAGAPRSEVGVALRMRLRASGGTGIFAWKLVRGELPSGVRLLPNGTVAGTPREAGTYLVTLRARDTEARDAAWTGTLRVAERIRIRTSALQAGRVGRPYTADLRSAGGVVPATWSLARGSLPRGVRLAGATGRLAGVPTKAARYRFTIVVRDGLGVRHASTLTVLVRPAARPATRTRGALAPG